MRTSGGVEIAHWSRRWRLGDCNWVQVHVHVVLD